SIVNLNNDRLLVCQTSDHEAALAELRVDDDHTVVAAHPVHRQAGLVLDDLDGSDVTRVDGPKGRTGSKVDRHAVHHIQRLVARYERADTADANGEAAAGRARHLHAAKAARQQLLDRLTGHALHVFFRQY